MKNIFKFLVLVLLVQSISVSAYHDRAWNKVKKNSQRAVLASACLRANSNTTIEYNNVRALIHTGGDMWWDLVAEAKYEVPKESGKTALFAGAIWIGGTDINDQLRLAALRFRNNGVDYWPGPLIISGMDRATVSADVCSQYDRHFPIERKDVVEFRNYIQAALSGDTQTLESQFEGYQIPDAILEWPAHGDAVRGYDYYLAPFFDADGSGHYNPESGGDYPFFDLAEGGESVECGTSREERKPRLFGDFTMWWVYNDKGNIHTETNGEAIGMEIRAQYFAFATADELNNMTFGNYALINRSTYTLYNTYFGVWTDADLGYAFDDFVGCDVQRGLGYLYNGKEKDGSGNGKEYGDNPPAVGIDFFEGPYMDPILTESGDTVHEDRPSPYKRDALGELTDELDLTLDHSILYNGGINGLNFGDSVPGNERWGMRRFLYFNNKPGVQGDPEFAQQYYNYLDGYWKDNRKLTFGGTGYKPSGGTEANFMFPGESDPALWGTEGVDPGYTKDGGWTEENENNQVDDRRFVQSAGPFTLVPGAINDITIGVVWARATNGSAFESVKKVQEADDKAQKLFENCFVMIDGPDAPELKITELDKELIFQIYNLKGSNNFKEYPEDYYQEDPFINLPADIETSINEDASLSDEEKAQKIRSLKSFSFEGYQVFQLKDKTVTTADIDNPEFSRLVFQCDLKNGISTIVNYVTEPITGKLQPKQMVVGNNKGLQHSFKLTQNAFATAEKGLVNHKEYYFIAVAYAYNQFKQYDPDSPVGLDGQKTPYLRGRKSASGSLKTVAATPHINTQFAGGTVLNSSYGELLPVTMVEGMGTGQNYLDLEKSTIDRIMSGAPWKSHVREYKAGFSPIQVSVVDPLNVKDENYILRFDSVKITTHDKIQKSGVIEDAYWYLYPESQDGQEIDTTLFVMINSTDAVKYDTLITVPMNYVIQNVVKSYETVTEIATDTFKVTGAITESFRLLPKDHYYSKTSIKESNDVTIPELGISITINQVGFPGLGYLTGSGIYSGLPGNVKNGYVGSSVEYDNPSKAWLLPVPDFQEETPLNWIATGNAKGGLYPSREYDSDKGFMDANNDWGSIAKGLFAIYRTLRYDVADVDKNKDIRYQVAANDADFNTCQLNSFDEYRRTPSIDIVITKDTNLWSRCPVIEMCEMDVKRTVEPDGTVTSAAFVPGPSQGRAAKFMLRKAASVYRNGKPMPLGVADSIYCFSKAYAADSGMGWFPGYAIDVETGERLNIFFGEDSRWGEYNGRDMLWNPHSKTATNLGIYNGELILGGKHNIYISGHSYSDETTLTSVGAFTSSASIHKSGAYDGGARIFAMLRNSEDNTLPPNQKNNSYKNVYNNIVYAGRAMLNPKEEDYDKEHDPYGFIKSNVTLKIRMANPYRGGGASNNSTFLKPEAEALNGNAPMFKFSTVGKGAKLQQVKVAESALDLINVVPNPYYAYNSYELSQTQKLVKITNLPNDCNVTIYNLGGNLIRRFRKSSPLSYIDWDLKNEYGIEIASGVYYIHIEVPGVGEKVLKWFGALRPIDLNSI